MDKDKLVSAAVSLQGIMFLMREVPEVMFDLKAAYSKMQTMRKEQRDPTLEEQDEAADKLFAELDRLDAVKL